MEGRISKPIELVESKESILSRVDQVKWNQEAMFDAAKCDAKQERLYEELYGPDQNSGEWIPVDDIPDAYEFILTGDFPPKKGYDFHQNLRAIIYWHVINLVKHSVLDGKRRIITNLYHPGRFPEGMEKAAFFRHVAIIPIFGSVKGFHNFLFKFRDDAKVKLYHFRDGHLEMAIDEVIQMFSDKGDEDGVDLAKFHNVLVHGLDDYLQYLNYIMALNRNDRDDY